MANYGAFDSIHTVNCEKKVVLQSTARQVRVTEFSKDNHF
jgi:hypothetical protein